MNSWKNIFALFKTLKKKRKLQLIFLLFSSLLSGLLEAFSMATFLPFLSILINPDGIKKLPFLDFLKFFFNTDNSNNMLLQITIVFIIITFLTGLIRILNIWFAAKISALIGSDVGVKVYKNSLYLPYIQQLRTNSSSLVNAIAYQSPNVLSVFYSANFILTSSFVFIFIIIGLITIDLKLTILIAIIISIIYFFIGLQIRKSLIKNSKIIDNFGKMQIQTLQEGIGFIRDIILENSYKIFIEKFKYFDVELNIKKSENKFYSTFPRFLIESLALIFLASLALTIRNIDDQGLDFLPLIGTFALGSQKLINASQQFYTNWSNLQAKSQDIYKILLILRNKTSEIKSFNLIKPYIFKHSIELKNIDFNYGNKSKEIINKLNLKIKKGEKIAIVGSTGSGKSTLVDIIMGLLEPSSGEILIDGEKLGYGHIKSQNNLISWRKAIAHVPQSIFLADASFTENIALGIPKNSINFDRVIHASKIACIHDFIIESSESYDGIVGERGLRISGGERQRIGIARAIYKNPKILILDEATSALDNETELKVINSINNFCSDMTIVMIAHRYNSIKNFNRVLKFEKGKIIMDDKPENVLKI